MEACGSRMEFDMDELDSIMALGAKYKFDTMEVKFSFPSIMLR